MRIAVDIDSTLHHYWDVLSEAARSRFGVELPYEEQFDWGITRLREEQLQVVIEATHCREAILAGRPYPDAVETLNRWHDAGHFVHVTSHRAGGCTADTHEWLTRIGLAFDDLHCSYDKIARCRELDIDLLIDDSPANIQRALECGITAATLNHPWNETVRDEEDVIAADDWATLAARLEEALPPLRRRAATA